MGLQDHKEVRIVQGVYRAPGDNNSVESSIKTIDLLSPAGGIGLQSWSPNLAALETGGIWTDSPLQVGRTPLVLNEGNVIETMRITINGGSPLGTMKKYSEFLIMMQNARRFWTDNAQIDPVFLHWFSSCGAGKQYALIYNMEFKPEYNDSPAAIITGSLTIEREPYWRFLPPGANPKQWSLEWNSQPFNSLTGELGSSALSNDLVISGTLQNKSEFSDTNSSALASSNFITIPGASIPGDAPALMNLFALPSSTSYNFIFGKKSIKIAQKQGAIAVAQNASIGFVDGTMGTNATTAADTGAVRSRSSATLTRVEISFATATNALRWSINGFGMSVNRMIGRWMVFLRCRQQGGTLGDITMYLRYGTSITSDSDGQKLNVVYPPVIAGAGNTTAWGFVYMGIINTPITPTKASVNKSAVTAGESVGLDSDASGDFSWGLFALRSAGAAPLYLCDLLFIPVDEGSISLELSDPTLNVGMWYDETGYFTHGTQDQYCLNGNPGDTTTSLVKSAGPGIQLTPGVENRLYFAVYNNSQQSVAGDTASFRVNIIPRCRGIRTTTNLLLG